MTGLFFLVLLAVLYFAPSICAAGKKGAAGIFVLNLFLGWTLIGWVVALSWALAAPKVATASAQSRLIVITPPRHGAALLRA